MTKPRENRSKQETRDRWIAVIDEWKRSKLKQRAYCKARNVSYWTFKYWSGILRKKAMSSLVPVTLKQHKESISISELCIIENNKLRIGIFHQSALAHLPVIIQALQ